MTFCYIKSNLYTKSKLHVCYSEWLLFNANSAIFHLYHGENKLMYMLNFHYCSISRQIVQIFISFNQVPMNWLKIIITEIIWHKYVNGMYYSFPSYYVTYACYFIHQKWRKPYLVNSLKNMLSNPSQKWHVKCTKYWNNGFL
jgi:hypothetical protein